MEFVEPSVKVVAFTQPTEFAEDMVGLLWDSFSPPHRGDVLLTPVVFGGRACYQSWDKPNPRTAEPADYVRNLISQRHYSVLEHSSVTLYLTGVSRALTHELIRHRHFSYSELSQRYVDMGAAKYVNPPAFGDEHYLAAVSHDVVDDCSTAYEVATSSLTEQGVKRKQAREAARAYLPNMIETKIVVTGNLRAWIEFLVKRDNPAADAEMQRLAKLVRVELVRLFPSVFDDDARTLWDDSFAQKVDRAVAGDPV